MAAPQQQQQQNPPPPKTTGPVVRTTQRVDGGDLYYRTTANPAWKQLDILDSRGAVPKTVAHIVFNGGIEVCQVGNVDSVDEGMMWKIRWEHDQYEQVHVDEFQRSGLDQLKHIAVQFRPLASPQGSAVALPDVSNKKKVKTGTNDDSSVGQASSSRAADAIPSQYQPFKLPTDPARFPISRLSHYFAEDGYTDFLLVFPRFSRAKGQRLWSWAATLTFLSGEKEWTSPPRKHQTEQLDQNTLTSLAASGYLSGGPIELRAAQRGYWLVRSGDQPEVPAVSDLPSAARTLPDEEQVVISVLKRQRSNHARYVESMKQRKLDIDKALVEYHEQMAATSEQMNELDMQLQAMGVGKKQDDEDKDEEMGDVEDGKGKEKEKEKEDENENEMELDVGVEDDDFGGVEV